LEIRLCPPLSIRLNNDLNVISNRGTTIGRKERKAEGNPVINPVIANADPLLFSPVFERIDLEILSVPPVLSGVITIIAPKIIRNPF
jgi:hypothetical protein